MSWVSEDFPSRTPFAVSTRRAKLPTSEDAFARWRQEAERLGIDVAHYAENRRDLEIELPGFREAEIAVRFADIPEILTEFEATFTHHDLYREIAASLVGTGAEVSRVDEEANRADRNRCNPADRHNRPRENFFDSRDDSP